MAKFRRREENARFSVRFVATSSDIRDKSDEGVQNLSQGHKNNYPYDSPEYKNEDGVSYPILILRFYFEWNQKPVIVVPTCTRRDNHGNLSWLPPVCHINASHEFHQKNNL